MEKIYDLSVQNQMVDNRRILKARDGIKYDVSFVPAILNRKYYKRWKELQAEVLKGLSDFVGIKSNFDSGEKISKEDNEKIDSFQRLADVAAAAGAELFVYAIRANGYSDFSEDELYTNFSEEGISLGIDFIMGLDQKEEVKKKVLRKQTS
jgi:hypothetical protein